MPEISLNGVNLQGILSVSVRFGQLFERRFLGFKQFTVHVAKYHLEVVGKPFVSPRIPLRQDFDEIGVVEACAF